MPSSRNDGNNRVLHRFTAAFTCPLSFHLIPKHVHDTYRVHTCPFCLFSPCCWRGRTTAFFELMRGNRSQMWPCIISRFIRKFFLVYFGTTYTFTRIVVFFAHSLFEICYVCGWYVAVKQRQIFFGLKFTIQSINNLSLLLPNQRCFTFCY